MPNYQTVSWTENFKSYINSINFFLDISNNQWHSKLVLYFSFVSVLVCAKHFEKKHFEADRFLKTSGVPSIFPLAAKSDEPSRTPVKIYTVEFSKNFLQTPAPLLSDSVSDLSTIDSDLSSFEDTSSSNSFKQELSEEKVETESDELRLELERLEALKKQLLGKLIQLL